MKLLAITTTFLFQLYRSIWKYNPSESGWIIFIKIMQKLDCLLTYGEVDIETALMKKLKNEIEAEVDADIFSKMKSAAKGFT
jgi:hypothetical protein